MNPPADGVVPTPRSSPRLRVRLAAWAFVTGFLLVAGVVWSLRGQRAPLHDREVPTPLHAVADDVDGMALDFSGWQPIFRGIDLGHGESPMGRAGKMKVDALRIHLTEPGVRMHATAGNGDAPLETFGESTVDFLARYGLSVAVNAHFFSPCCDARAEPKDLVGLAIADGELVSPPSTEGGAGSCVLVVRDDGVAAVLDDPGPSDPTGIRVAVAGSDVLVRDGALVAPPETAKGFGSSNPRTAVGVDATGRVLILLTIDGRQIGWSNGATLRETGAWMRLLGAHDAINLDGGGSTTMVRAGEDGPELVNSPVGLGIRATLRWNGSNLGASAAPLPPTDGR